MTFALSFVESIGSAGSWGIYFAVDWASYIAGEAARRAGDSKTASYFPRGSILIDDVELGNRIFDNAMEDVMEVTASATLNMANNFYYENGLDIMGGLDSGDYSFIAVRVDGSDSEIAQYMSDAFGYSSISSYKSGDPIECPYINDRYHKEGLYDGMLYDISGLCDFGENDNYKFARVQCAGKQLDLAIVENGGSYVFNAENE